ncbi:MAG: uracil-DNA glycosylase [Solobacterium sp.]|nr:uracil-DNA glycosylase [Solobacterium sp.]
MKRNSWTPWLQNEFQQPYFRSLAAFVHEEYETRRIFPPKQQVFSAFENCDYPDIRVVILDQDPYINYGQAHGMCFSVNPGVALPPSLQNIFKEISDEYGCPLPNNGYLMPWARQGVFLLNAVLTVREGASRSHAGKGWETFTSHAVEKISEKEDPVVFLLWGRDARNKKALINTEKHLVLEAAHPSPLSAYNGFFGCGHFRKANAFLKQMGRGEIDWPIRNI